MFKTKGKIKIKIVIIITLIFPLLEFSSKNSEENFCNFEGWVDRIEENFVVIFSNNQELLINKSYFRYEVKEGDYIKKNCTKDEIKSYSDKSYIKSLIYNLKAPSAKFEGKYLDF